MHQYPVAYYDKRGWSLGNSQLPFTAFLVGIALGAGIIAFSTATNFTRSFNKHGKSIPEERLPPMIVGAICLPIGLFWFGCKFIASASIPLHNHTPLELR